ncbi:sigma factor G inhibitor Gin [Caldalkalibacillus salinus]|uniref:sigma factor G inhibitor Gin n=1 Tax=Caldalkalibacillus salinus TaxID=2803787 RepID=UPI00192118BE|nr:sigma factor G inhibitor Gin [Caldalkalibacillus salinus]
MQAQVKQRVPEMCVICSRHQDEGIHIWHQFICRECETEIVMTDVSEEKYNFFVQQMKRIWLKENA